MTEIICWCIAGFLVTCFSWYWDGVSDWWALKYQSAAGYTWTIIITKDANWWRRHIVGWLSDVPWTLMILIAMGRLLSLIPGLHISWVFTVPVVSGLLIWIVWTLGSNWAGAPWDTWLEKFINRVTRWHPWP